MSKWPQVEVEVRPVTAPNREPGVLLQLPDGYVVMTPEAATSLAQRLTQTAIEIKSKGN